MFFLELVSHTYWCQLGRDPSHTCVDRQQTDSSGEDELDGCWDDVHGKRNRRHARREERFIKNNRCTTITNCVCVRVLVNYWACLVEEWGEFPR
jgi:hypothetical protein